MINITHLITDSGAGGAEKILYELCTRLDRGRFHCKVIALKRPRVIFERLQAAGIECVSLNLPPRVGPAYLVALPAAFIRLVRRLKADRPDVLHGWLFQGNFFGRIAARIAGVPVNLSSLRVMEMERWSHYPLDRLTKSLVTRYLAVCDAVARHAETKLGLPAGAILAIPNGIDPAPYLEADGAALRKELGLSADAVVIGVAARLHRQKAIEVLIEAAARLAKTFPTLRLLIAGVGPEHDRLVALARSLGVADAVIFLGEWRRMPEFLAGLELFVLPSRWEGMPNAVLEAMAAARPVVATTVGGTPELVVGGWPDLAEDNETGILVPPDDADALFEALGALIQEPARAKKMGTAGRRRVLERFTMDRMIERYEVLYQAVRSQ